MDKLKLKTPMALLCAASLLSVSLAASANPSRLEGAAALAASGDFSYIAARVLSELPKAVLDITPQSFIKYNALRIKGGHGHNKC